MDTQHPEISVIVPVYNVAPYLAACVDSLLAQTFPSFELILVDDGSTDDSCKMAEAYAAKDARVRLVQRRWNCGLAAARNLGVEVSRGRYVIFVDADDIVAPDYLDLLYRVAEQQQADIVQAGFQEFAAQPGDGRAWSWVTEPTMLSTDLGTRVDCFVPYVRLHIAAWCKLYRRAFLDAHHLVFCDVSLAEDICYHYQCLLTAARYAVLPDILYHYRVRAASLDHAQRGVQRARSYVVTLARTMESFTAWMAHEPALADATLQRELRYVLLLYIAHQTRGDLPLPDAFDACRTALADEPHAALFDALLYKTLRDEQT